MILTPKGAGAVRAMEIVRAYRGQVPPAVWEEMEAWCVEEGITTTLVPPGEPRPGAVREYINGEGEREDAWDL